MSGSYYFEKISQQVAYPLHVFEATSPRKILFVLNFFLALVATVITTYSIYLVQLLYNPYFITGWFNWLILVIVGGFLMVVSIVGMRGAHQVSLELLLSYFWSVLVLFAPLLLGIFAVFNISFYTRIWFEHEWNTADFESLRETFCDPRSTANSKCRAPTSTSPVVYENVTYSSADAWCIRRYNATDCSEIRADAINLAVEWGTSLILANFVMGLVGVLLMAACIYMSVQILTHPVITQSMLEIINYLLVVPIAACIGQTVGFWWIQSMTFKFTWLPKVYCAVAAAQVVALPLGIAAGRYMTLVVMIIAGLALAAVMGWTLATVVLYDFEPSTEQIADIACRKTLPGCSECGNAEALSCPEWSRDDVLTLFSLDFRLTGMVSSLACVYLLGALIVAGLVDNNLKNYKTDFI